jgi:hypothetical protein
MPDRGRKYSLIASMFLIKNRKRKNNISSIVEKNTKLVATISGTIGEINRWEVDSKKKDFHS